MSYGVQFRELLSTKSVDELVNAFLRSFVGEFASRFEEVLVLANDFKSFAISTRGQTVQELDEFEAHRFFERKGHAITVKDLRDKLAQIDFDNNHKLSILEYLLYHYDKTIAQFFEAKPNAAAVAKLEAAIAQYRQVFAEREAKAAKMEELKAQAAAGNFKAKSELRRLEMESDQESAKNEALAIQQKLAAKRAMKNPAEEEERLFQEEQARVAEAKRQQEIEEQRKRDDSRARLKAKASLWQ